MEFSVSDFLSTSLLSFLPSSGSESQYVPSLELRLFAFGVNLLSLEQLFCLSLSQNLNDITSFALYFLIF